MPVRKKGRPVIINNVTAQRAFYTVYTNNTGRTVCVLVSVVCFRANVPAPNGAYVTGFVDGQNVSWAGFFSYGNHLGRAVFQIFMIVPAGITYEVRSYVSGVGSTVDLAFWQEVTL